MSLDVNLEIPKILLLDVVVAVVTIALSADALAVTVLLRLLPTSSDLPNNVISEADNDLVVLFVVI